MLSRNNSLEKTSREGQARSQLRTTTTSLRYDPAAIETLFVGLFLESQTRAQAQIVLDCHGRSAAFDRAAVDRSRGEAASC
jgi:hypothetical protein